ncbi:uncharacterized protein [Atheta coriaria]|uniref:uncharacterized protein n=1 Tax=Dalotia coriaria TaxID=877792 RepID=UPI0031F47017
MSVRRFLPENQPKMNSSDTSFVNKLANRQILGKFANESHSKSKTELPFKHIHPENVFILDDLFDYSESQYMVHIYMGFTICGQYFVSYKENIDDMLGLSPLVSYELYVWRFVPGKRFAFHSKHKIFKLLKHGELDEITFMQYPTDPYKLYCYGVVNNLTPSMSYLTILTLPISDNCRFCNENVRQIDDSLSQGWCLTHGFMLHYMFTMSQPAPTFDPNVSLAFPDYFVINTGYYIHILNTSCYKPPLPTMPFVPTTNSDELTLKQHFQSADTLSEASETSDNFSANSIVEAILEDFRDDDLLDTGDGTKPFHELNISCEPLNVTGKSYHNALVQKGIVDPRLKRLQGKEYTFSVPQSSSSQKEKQKIDKKIAEKAYEFTEETEKCEKLSSFRKKRLADKKYEFSEDNSENIVPFNSLRKERRYLFKSRTIKSPEFSGLFLSPRSSGIRSPMQSPNSRHGQFSPAGRNIYCPGLRHSPHHSKSPISPREYRKFNVYSPGLDSDFSDYDSKLVLRQINNLPESNSKVNQPAGLLIVDSKKDESYKWIKKVVRRFSNGDFENSSLLSGQSRDDYNIPIEIPILVQTLADQHLDIIPEFKADLVTETQLIVTQRSFDYEQFVQSRAQRLCNEHDLVFLHCEDYDMELLHICPLEGFIICKSVIKICAMKMLEQTTNSKLHTYVAQCLFSWNIQSNAFELIEPPEPSRLHLHIANVSVPKLDYDLPRFNARPVLIMNLNVNESKEHMRDYNNRYEIRLGSGGGDHFFSPPVSLDSDLDDDYLLRG